MDRKYDYRGAVGRSPLTGPTMTQHQLAPGKRTLTEAIVVQPGEATADPCAEVSVTGTANGTAASRPAPLLDPATTGARPTLQMLFGVQRTATPGPAEDPAQVHAAAARGTATPATRLPYADQIQRAFGRHDISRVQAHVGSDAAETAREMGAQAYATGDHVVLGAEADLHTAAHEAAHVVQQRGGVQLEGGVGEVGDAYERHADAVADAVAAGQSAEPLLDSMAGGNGPGHGPVQRKLYYDAARTSLSSGPDEAESPTDHITVEKGDLIELRGCKGDAIYRVETVSGTLTLRKFSRGKGADEIKIGNKPRSSYIFGPGKKINGVRSGFDTNGMSDSTGNNFGPVGAAVGPVRVNNWNAAYDRSLTVVTSGGEQSHAINNLTIFHLTLNATDPGQTHVTINTDTLKLYLNGRAKNLFEFRAQLQFLQAVNLQAWTEAGGQGEHLLGIGSGNDANHAKAFADAFGEAGGTLANKHDFARQPYASGGGAGIKAKFEEEIPTTLLPGGYSHADNIHFRISPAAYNELTSSDATYVVDEGTTFAAIMSELEAGLNACFGGFGTAIVKASRAQLDAQMNEDHVLEHDYARYFMVRTDIPQYREIAEMIKKLGGRTAMLD